MTKNGSVWLCLVCNLEKRFKVHMIDHVESKHVEQADRLVYTCYLCNNAFSSRNSFRTHRSRFHKQS